MSRRIINLIAIIGLLFHVAASAHTVTKLAPAMGSLAAGTQSRVSQPVTWMAARAGDASTTFDAKSFEAQLADALLVICRGAGQDQSSDTGKHGGATKCPLCSLAHVAQALPPETEAFLYIPPARPLLAHWDADERSEFQRKIRPPSRAPPSVPA